MAKPQSAAEVLKLIRNELHLLWAQMDTYQTLYLIEQDKRRQLMADTAPGFFAVIQATLIESLLLRICRLLDPAEQNGNANVSVETLWLLLPKDEQSDEPRSREELRSTLRELLDDWNPRHCDRATGTVGNYDRLKKLRRKVLAHNDFTLRRRTPDELWADVTQEDYELIQNVASRLWSISRMAMREIEGPDEIEPQPTRLEDQPVMLLRQLASGMCLDKLLDEQDDDDLRLRALQCWTQGLMHHVGDERQRDVFGSST